MTRKTPVFHQTTACGLLIFLAGLPAVVGCTSSTEPNKSELPEKSQVVSVTPKPADSAEKKKLDLHYASIDRLGLDEPAGITAAAGKLYVADTNHHVIRVIDLNDGNKISTLQIDGLQPPQPPRKPAVDKTTSDAQAEPSDEPPDEKPEKKDETEAGAGAIPHPFPDARKAPSLEGGLSWINTDGPIDLEKLRGKWVLLDFWTYCCINCMHILPELKKLERAHPNDLVVIGVHSAKFDGEKDSQNITDAVLRHEIEHPVVNDANHTIWNNYYVQSWPSLRVIDPEGNLVVGNSGEITFEDLDEFFKRVTPYYEQKGLLDTTPLKFRLQEAAETPLRFPGKVLADEASDRLFIADSNHNRIVVTKLDGSLIEIIGTGAIGAADGAFDVAEFNHPQGMALKDETLYVADTENHLLRKIDLLKKTVTTISGTGVQGRNAWPGFDVRAFRFGDGKLPERFVGNPSETALNSPWALWVHEKNLYIAMAGPHQIWKMTLDEKEIGPYAGNGREDVVDGPLLPPEPHQVGFSSFAQPSGLASDGTWLYVADSEGSSIRAVPFDPKQDVKTIVGTSRLSGGRLFIFGDRDGEGLLRRNPDAFFQRGADQTLGPLLQHCLGVVFYKDKLYVTDTYNNKIKIIDPKTGRCDTLAGNNKPSFPNAVTQQIASVQVKPEQDTLRLSVKINLPEGFKMNPDAPMYHYVEAAGERGPLDREKLGRTVNLDEPTTQLEITLPLKLTTGSEMLTVSLVYYYCGEKDAAVCKVGSVIWNVPITLSADAAASSVPLEFTVPEGGSAAKTLLPTTPQRKPETTEQP